MKKLILIFAVVVFSLILILLILNLRPYDSHPDLLHFKQKGKDFERVNLKEYKEYIYINGGSLEPLMVIWWQEMADSHLWPLDHPFKKFCITSELRTIMNELDILSQNKKTQLMTSVPGEKNTLRIYLSSWNQIFRILEIEFALDPNSHEFVTSYGRSTKLYELLSSKERCEDFWDYPGKGRVDSNEYQEHLRKVREFGRSRKADANQQKQ